MPTGNATGSDELTISVTNDGDIVRARNAGREMCRRIGFRKTDEVKVATAISELARNIALYAGCGAIAIRPLREGRRGIEVVARDKGPGIENLEEVLGRRFRSRTGLGLGLAGAKRLMDTFDIETRAGQGTVVTARKFVQ